MKNVEKEELYKKLKCIKTFEELKAFLAILSEMGFGLCTKRMNKLCFSFILHPDNEKRVCYLMDDGISRGSCKIKNLYRYMAVR